MSRRLDDDWEEAKAPDQTIEQQIENIILMYGYDTEAVIEDLVLQQYPEKVIQAHTDLLDEAKQALLQLLNEARIDEATHFVVLTDGVKHEVVYKQTQHEYLTKDERIAQLMENK